MNILLTGASGFVGQNLFPYLKLHGHNVSPLPLRNEGWQNSFFNNYNSFIHLAGKAHDTKNTSAPELYFEINTRLTEKLFDCFLQSTAKDFIYFSSVKAAADTVDNVLTEDTIPNPQTPYGISKLQAEKYILSKDLPPNKRVFILRPCMIHGPGNKGNLNLLHKVVSEGLPYPLAAFDNKRSFTSIKNLEYIIGKVIEDDTIQSGIYNVADDYPISTNHLINLIGQCSQNKVRLWSFPKPLIKAIANIGDFLKLPLNSERLKKLTESYIVDNSKIKTALKINQLPVSADEGLLETLKYF